MLYKLTWQTKVIGVWGEPQFVIGEIGAVHKCYNALILAFTPKDGLEDPKTQVRAVVTSIAGDDDFSQNIVYEWGWPRNPHASPRENVKEALNKVWQPG